MAANISQSECGRESLSDEPRRIIFGLISQLKKGVDLHKITLPTFVLEPRSMCERILDIMSNADLMSGTVDKEDPMDRFIDVVRYFLAGWHLRPKGVKKPYNPILGEFFRCICTTQYNSKCIYVCEQVSHHPPASAYFFSCPENDVWIQGEVWPKSNFLGNSVVMRMNGTARLTFSKKRPNEEYVITLPAMYAHGILFGSMYIELGDTVYIKCPSTNIYAEIHFQKKGIFGSNINEIKGKIKTTSSKKVLYSISGYWSSICYITPHNPDGSKSHHKAVLFDVSALSPLNKHVEDVNAQEDFESRNLWKRVTKHLIANDMDNATKFKTKIEDNQRKLVKHRDKNNVLWVSRYFNKDSVSGEWKFDISNISSDPEKAYSELYSRVFSQSSLDVHRNFWIIPSGDSRSSVVHNRSSCSTKSSNSSSNTSFKSTQE